MKAKWIASPCVAAALVLTPVTRAAADAGDAIAGAIVGGIIGHVVTKEAMKNKQQKQKTYRKSSAGTGVSSAQREQNREVQTALNHFGYGVGTPDGVLGAKSKAAISQYQALIGYAPTGQLTEYERTLLVTAYHRAIAGGPQVTQIASTHPMGLRGLLLVQRDEMAGIAPGTGGTGLNAPAGGVPATGQPATGTLAAAGLGTAIGTAAGLGAPATAAPALPQFAAAAEEAPVSAAPGLPSFFGTAAPQVSLASHCNKVSLQTNTNGGYVTAASMTDPGQALGEQFCIARTYAMASSEELSAKVAGFTPQQIADQCKGFGPALADQIAALSVKPRDQVLEGVSGFVLGSGMSPAQLAGTARICLGVGYTTDAMDVSLGSALILTALGEQAYAELIGHHLLQGFGVSPRPDLAAEWYQAGLNAVVSGKGVFAPGLPERTDVIRKAVFTMGGKAEGQGNGTAPSTLPLFAPLEAAPPGASSVITAAAPAVPESEPKGLTPGAAISAAARLPLMVLGN